MLRGDFQSHGPFPVDRDFGSRPRASAMNLSAEDSGGVGMMNRRRDAVREQHKRRHRVGAAFCYGAGLWMVSSGPAFGFRFLAWVFGLGFWLRLLASAFVMVRLG